MSSEKKVQPIIKERLHERNIHRERYDFDLLIEKFPELAAFVILNKYQDRTIDFANPQAVKCLNKALLITYYNINYWDIPDGYLCPPIPGRADYIHHIADMLRHYNYGKMVTGSAIKIMDVGVGANCIYPIIGQHEYGWTFIGSEIDPIAIEAANKIIDANPPLKNAVEIRLQPNKDDIFFGVLEREEPIDLVICNPPFHSSRAEAQDGTIRKNKNLGTNKKDVTVQNFGGQANELWCEGGESKFVKNMIRQSRQFCTSTFWFSTLVSKESHLKEIHSELKRARAVDFFTIPMGQGNKSSRIVVWTFLTSEEQQNWIQKRWNLKN